MYLALKYDSHKTERKICSLYSFWSQKRASAGVCSSQSLSELSAMAESTRVKAERKLICIMSPFEDQAPL